MPFTVGARRASGSTGAFSAVLSGIMVAAGSFGIMRVAYNVFGVALLRELDVMALGRVHRGVHVVFAALLAVNQDNLKRRLAYSTFSQMGYAALGVALLSEQAATGASSTSRTTRS